jgi:hypothetical protein
MLKSHTDKASNWSQRCITCKDSWVCGSCYHQWDIEGHNTDTSCGYETMPCVICNERMNYSHLVNMFDEGTGSGWWDHIKKGYEDKPVWRILDKDWFNPPHH